LQTENVLCNFKLRVYVVWNFGVTGGEGHCFVAGMEMTL